MFSGLVREIAIVQDFSNHQLSIQSPLQASIGDSIAINGACLTIIALRNNGFVLELTEHTQQHIAIENLKNQVHLEPALRASDRLDGHFVQGHIDAIGKITQITHLSNQSIFKIETPRHIHSLLIPKGSVAIDGISLTITDFYAPTLELTLIPHTLKETLFQTYTIGRRVNIETDILVRSVAHLLQKNPTMRWDEFDQMTLGY